MAKENKMKPTNVPVDVFLETVTERRRNEAREMIALMQEISGEPPVMWGESIIGFGLEQYRYESGRSGEMPRLAFSPRKAKFTVYFQHGYEALGALREKLGKHTITVSCLYFNRLEDIDLSILRKMLEAEWNVGAYGSMEKSVSEYLEQVPACTKPLLLELREIVRAVIPHAEECISYGIIGYRTVSKKRARVFIGGYSDHVSLYPVPQNEDLLKELAPYKKGKGTLHFIPGQTLPRDLIEKTVHALIE